MDNRSYQSLMVERDAYQYESKWGVEEENKLVNESPKHDSEPQDNNENEIRPQNLLIQTDHEPQDINSSGVKSQKHVKRMSQFKKYDLTSPISRTKRSVNVFSSK